MSYIGPKSYYKWSVSPYFGVRALFCLGCLWLEQSQIRSFHSLPHQGPNPTPTEINGNHLADFMGAGSDPRGLGKGYEKIPVIGTFKKADLPLFDFEFKNVAKEILETTEKAF